MGAHAPLLRWLFSVSSAGIAPAFLIFNAAVAAVLVWAPYTFLVEFSMLLQVLHVGYTSVARRLHVGCTSVARRLHVGYTLVCT